jgi:hypothetical protein
MFVVVCGGAVETPPQDSGLLKGAMLLQQTAQSGDGFLTGRQNAPQVFLCRQQRGLIGFALILHDLELGLDLGGGRLVVHGLLQSLYRRARLATETAARATLSAAVIIAVGVIGASATAATYSAAAAASAKPASATSSASAAKGTPHSPGHDFTLGIENLRQFGFNGVPFRVIFDFHLLAQVVHHLLPELGGVSSSSSSLGCGVACAQGQYSGATTRYERLL